jgi:hypothetical protein
LSLLTLRSRYPWPQERPRVPRSDHGWFSGRAEVFEQFTGPDVDVFLELGSWMGKSARWFAQQCPHATIVCVDHWEGSPEHLRKDKWKKHLPTLHETFLTNMWELRDRVIPVREKTLPGMQAVAEAGVQPDVVYVDAAHDADSVYHDLKTALDLFPNAQMIGDDWTIEGVREGVRKLLGERGAEELLSTNEAVWYLKQTREEGISQ